MASVTMQYRTVGSAGSEFSAVCDHTTTETIYEDGRVVNESTGAVRTFPGLDLATVRRARVERGWTVLYESI